MTIAEKIKAATQKVSQQSGTAPSAAPEVMTVSSQSLKTNAKSGNEVNDTLK